MNTDSKSITASYRIVCEHCHKLLFYSGQESPEIFKVLCDRCAQIY